jgi:hypothetical protein
MKMMNKTSLALVIATALGTYLPEANAVIKLTDTAESAPRLGANSSALGGKVILAAEESGEASLAVKSYYGGTGVAWGNGDLSVIMPVPSGYVVQGTKTLFVRVTLTGGAKFAAEPVLVCPNKLSYQTAAGTPANASDVAQGTYALIDNSLTTTGYDTDYYYLQSAQNSTTSIQASLGLITSPTLAAKGKATATFNFVSGLTTTQSGCLLTFTPAGAEGFTAAYTITTRGDVGMNVEVGYVQGGATAVDVKTGVFLTFKTAVKSVITASQVQGSEIPTVTISVKQASKKFLDGSNDAVASPTQATLGGIKIVSAYEPKFMRLSSVTGFGTLVSAAGAVLTTATLTIDGPLMNGVKTVGLFGTEVCGTPSTVSVVSPSSTSAGTSVVIAGIPVASAVLGLNICASVDGVNTLTNGQLTGNLVGGGVSNFAPDLSPSGNLVNVGIDGARVRVLNIPASNNADQVFLRFYNTSSQSAVVRGTLYGQDGKAIGTENSVLFSELKPYSVAILDAAKLSSTLGITTPWTGRAWLLVQAEIDKDSFKVAGLVRTPANILVNLSTDAGN